MDIKTMEKWSKKYNKYFLLNESNQHPNHSKLFRIGNYWYRPDKDILIHKDTVEDYINNCTKLKKSHRKTHYLNKMGIKISEEQETNNSWKEILKNKINENEY